MKIENGIHLRYNGKKKSQKFAGIIFLLYLCIAKIGSDVYF
jgi:hypothetical protein